MFTGRIGRLGLLLGLVYTLALPVIAVLLFVAAGYSVTGHNPAGVNIMMFLIGSLYSLLTMPVIIGLSIRRWNDLNASGWLAILNIIPVINTFVLPVMLFGRGTK